MMDSAPTRATPIRPSFPKLLDCSEPHLVSPNDFSDYVQEGHDADESQTQDQDHERAHLDSVVGLMVHLLLLRWASSPSSRSSTSGGRLRAPGGSTWSTAPLDVRGRVRHTSSLWHRDSLSLSLCGASARTKPNSLSTRTSDLLFVPLF